MRKKLPKSVRVGMVDYTLSYDLADVGVNPDDFVGRAIAGVTCHLLKSIYLNPDESAYPAAQCNTVWHEITHAIFAEYGLSGLEQVPEELVAGVMGGAISQIVRDNPELVAWTRYAVTS